jgi:hypothetical protein
MKRMVEEQEEAGGTRAANFVDIFVARLAAEGLNGQDGESSRGL